MKPAPHSSFLVTSIGAYDDSGSGTGGFTCLHEGQTTVVDRIDSTGLTVANGLVYRMVRGLRSIAGYDAGGLRSLLKVPGVRDAHDVTWHGGQFVCVATGTNEVVWLDAFGQETRRWQAEGEGDAWHLNCLTEWEGRLYLCAFGQFPGHRGWAKAAARGKGFVRDLETGEVVLSNLSGPHNPRMVEGEWAICDSHASSLVLERPGGPRRQAALRSFTRGLAWDENFFYVGESADRKAPVPSHESTIAVVERESLEVVQRHLIPFPEIYELILAQPAMAAAVGQAPEMFQLAQEGAQLQALQQQVAQMDRENGQMRERLRRVKTLEYWQGRAVEWKRRWLG